MNMRRGIKNCVPIAEILMSSLCSDPSEAVHDVVRIGSARSRYQVQSPTDGELSLRPEDKHVFVSAEEQVLRAKYGTPVQDDESSSPGRSHMGQSLAVLPFKKNDKTKQNSGVSLGVDFTRRSFNSQKNGALLRSCQGLIEAPGYHASRSLLLGRLSQSASWVIFEVTGLSTPLWCRRAHPHSQPSRSSFIRPSEWSHSSPSPPLVTLCLC